MILPEYSKVADLGKKDSRRGVSIASKCLRCDAGNLEIYCLWTSYWIPLFWPYPLNNSGCSVFSHSSAVRTRLTLFVSCKPYSSLGGNSCCFDIVHFIPLPVAILASCHCLWKKISTLCVRCAAKPHPTPQDKKKKKKGSRSAFKKSAISLGIEVCG